jgi:hypothetical protein
LCDSVKEAIWIKRLVEGFILKVPKQIYTFVDNQSSIKMATNDKEFSARTKFMDIRYHFIKDLHEQKKVVIFYVPTHENVADLLTKPLGKIKIENLRKLANLRIL